MQLTGSLNRHIIWKMLGLFIQLLITVFLSRILGAAESGSFFYFISWLSFFILIGSGGLDSAITYFIASGKMPKKWLLHISVFWLLLVAAIFYFLGVLFTDQLQFLKSFQDHALLYGFIFLLGQSAINYFIAFFYGEHRYIFPAQLIFFVNLIYALLLIYTAFFDATIFNHLFLIKTYILSVAIQGFALAVFYILYSDVKKQMVGVVEHSYSQFFSYGFSAFCANILFFAATRIDYWLLDKFNISDADIGNYIQVSRIVQLFQIFPSILAAYFFPKTAASGDKIIPYLTILIRWIIIANLILVMPIIIGGKYLFPFIFGASFDQMYVLFLLYLPGIISLTALSVIATYFAGVNKVIVNMQLSLMSLLLVFIGNIIFIKSYGVKASAVISSIAYSSSFVLGLIIFSKKTGISLKNIFYFRKDDLKILRHKFMTT